MNFKVVLHSIIAAFAGGVIMALEQFVQNGFTMPTDQAGWNKLAGIALGGGLTGVLLLLKQSPIDKPAPNPPAEPEAK